MVELTEYITMLDDMGFYEVALPFLLVFVLIFGILEKINLFGSRNSQINLVVAIIISFFVVRSDYVVGVMNTFLPKVSLAVLVLIMFLMIVGIFGLKAEGFQGYALFIGVLASAGAIVWALSADMIPSTWGGLFSNISSPEKALLIGVGALILIMYFVVRKPDNQQGRIGKGLQDLASELGRGGRP